MNSSGNSMRRNGTVDFFKFIFTLIIVVFHARPLFAPEGSRWFGSGRIAVEFFFIVSGYLLAEKAQRASLQRGKFNENLRMLKGKVLRFFPYILIAAVCGCIFYSIRDNSAKSLTNKLLFSLSDIYGLQMLGYPFFAATGVSWYLSVLFSVSFLVYPVLLYKRELFTKYIGPVSAIAILGYIAHTAGALDDPGAWWGLTFKGMLRGYAEISLGCMAYEISAYYRNKEDVNRTACGILEAIGYIVVLGYAVIHAKSDSYDFLIIPVILMVVTLSFTGKSRFSQFFDRPIFSKLGIFSFSIYLNHYFVVELFNRGAFSELSQPVRLLVCGGMIAALSFLNYFLGKWLAKRINSGTRMLYATLIYVCAAVMLFLVIR